MDIHTPVLSLVSELNAVADASGLEDETSRREALRIAKLLTTSLESPANVAFETSLLPSFTLCARIAVQLNIFSALAESDQPRSASDLANLASAEKLLVGMGLVQEVEKETYAALPVTKALASPPMQANMKHLWDHGVNCMAKFPQYLEERGLRCPSDSSDGLFQYAFNTKLEAFDYMHRNPQKLDDFNTSMTGVRSARPSWVEWFPVQERILNDARASSQAPLLVDVGGGRGHDIDAFLKKFSQPAGALVLQDLPAVIEDIVDLDVKIQRVKYSFFEPQPIQNAKVYYFSHIFHDWTDEPCLKILRNTAVAMSSESRLLINDIILPDTGCTLLQAGFDINMMAMHAGIERTRDQWKELLDRAGFEVVDFWLPPGDGEGIVEARLKQ